MAGSPKDTAFRTLIDILFEEQKAAWSPERPEDRPPQSSLEVKRAVSAHYKGWQELNTDSKLPTKQANVVDFEQDRFLMPLPPLQKDSHLVPWLSIMYKHPTTVGADFEKACCRIYVLMLGQDEKKRPIGLGFRIESPEKNCQNSADDLETGLHDFYHAQLIRKLRTHGPIFDTPDWLPCKQPSFPLWALNPVDALLNLVLTLYGARYYNEFLRKYSSRFGMAMSREFRTLNERLQKS